jgi:hypothetical protein
MIHGDDQPVLVPADVEDDPVLADDATRSAASRMSQLRIVQFREPVSTALPPPLNGS